MSQIKLSKEKKIAGSGLRVLELLKAMTKEPLSSSEMLKLIEEKSDNVYRREVISKYLNTLKLLGLDIIKIKDKYYLERSIEKINFTETDLSLLKFLEKYTRGIHLETLNENVTNALQIIEKNFSNETCKLITSSNIKPFTPTKRTEVKDSNVRMFEKYCNDALKLEITCKNGLDGEEKNYKIAPLKILYKNGKAVLVAYDCLNNEYKEFLPDFITQTTQTPQKNVKGYPTTVTFKLKGRLAKAYVLKAGEKVLSSGTDFVVISNSNEDKDMLVRRLIRYYDSCEILYPKSVRQKMIDFADSIQKIYE